VNIYIRLLFFLSITHQRKIGEHTDFNLLIFVIFGVGCFLKLVLMILILLFQQSLSDF